MFLSLLQQMLLLLAQKRVWEASYVLMAESFHGLHV